MIQITVQTTLEEKVISVENYFMPEPIQDQEFEIIRQMVYEQTGINLSPQKKIMVQSRLIKRLKEVKCPDFKQYVKICRSEPQERAIMFNLITTNVTQFFRENHHFEFINKFLPQYYQQAGPNKVINIWSAGCSTGQEPYSMAITLNEYFEKHKGDYKIVASDINTEVLRRAQDGIYNFEEVNEIPYDFLKKYFRLGQGSNKGLFKMKEILQRKIKFRQINLADNNPEFLLDGQFDFIFCRNVFIYFDKQTKKRAIRKFYNKLYEGGCLFLGHSETLNTYDMTLGHWIPLEHTVYKKKDGGTPNE